MKECAQTRDAQRNSSSRSPGLVWTLKLQDDEENIEEAFKSTRDAEPTVGVSKIKRHTIRSAGTVITEKRLAARAVAEFCFDCTHSNNASSSSATETVAHVPA